MAEFKPNIYPIIYWGLLFGLIAGFILFVLNILSNFITLLWFPVFLAGVVWGGYRNYKKQKEAFATSNGQALTPKPVMEEFKDAAHDIVDASREMLAEERQRESQLPHETPLEVAEQQEEITQPRIVQEQPPGPEPEATSESKPPQPPTPPSSQ